MYLSTRNTPFSLDIPAIRKDAKMKTKLREIIICQTIH